MGKVLNAQKVKRLPVGTNVYVVREATNQRGLMWIIKSGRKKLLRGVYAQHEIKDRAGWHYELEG